MLVVDGQYELLLKFLRTAFEVVLRRRTHDDRTSALRNALGLGGDQQAVYLLRTVDPRIEIERGVVERNDTVAREPEMC